MLVLFHLIAILLMLLIIIVVAGYFIREMRSSSFFSLSMLVWFIHSAKDIMWCAPLRYELGTGYWNRKKQ